MKKTLAFMTLNMLVSLAAVGATVMRTNKVGAGNAWATGPQAAQSQEGQAQPAAQKKGWKSTDEYNAFNAAATEKDPNKKISLAEAFLQKYSNSDFKDLAYLQEVAAYQQLRDASKMYQAAHRALEANPESVDAVYWEGQAFPYLFKATDPNAAAELAQTEADTRHGLDVLQKTEKPANLSDEQFSQQIKGVRATFNDTLGFIALQKKDYASAVTALKAASEDAPNDFTAFYRLGLAYWYGSPPDYDNATWNMARAAALAKAAQNPFEADIMKDLNQLYVGYHGSDAGLQDVITQASASANPPAGFKVTPAEKHKPTGNQAVDYYYSLEDTLKAGGDQAKTVWDQTKGQSYGFGGKVASAEAAPGGGYNIGIAITDEGKAKETPEIIVRSKQADAQYLAKGDIVKSFQGTIAENSLTPSFTVTLDGTIDEDSLAAAKAKHAKGKAKPKPHTATRHTKTSG